MNTVGELIELIAQKGVAGAVRACRRPPLSTRLLRELYQDFRDRPQLMEFIATYPLIPSDLAEQMVAEIAVERKDVAVALAGNPRTPPTALQRLLRVGSGPVMIQLATNPRLSQREFAVLAQNADAAIRAEVARHPNLPIGWQLILAGDAEAQVRSALAARKSLDFDIAIALGSDAEPAVRAALLNNPDASDELRQLHADCDHLESHRVLLASKRPLPETVAASLRLSPHGEIRRTACSAVTPSGPELLFLAESEDPADRMFVAALNPLPLPIQRLLLADPTAKVRRKLAANEGVDPTIAATIAASEDVAAASALAANPVIDGEVVFSLCHHSSDTVAEIVTLRTDLQPVHWDALIHRETTAAAELLAFDGVGYIDTREARAVELAASPYPSVRVLAARSRHLPSAAFWQLAKDRAPAVLLAVAQNPAAPKQLLYELSGSRDRTLAFAAEDSLRTNQNFPKRR